MTIVLFPSLSAAVEKEDYVLLLPEFSLHF